MTRHLSVAGNAIAYDLTGQGPLVVLAHDIGDSRHSCRFLAPALAAEGYRVAHIDIRGCGESSLGWEGYSRTDIAGDLVRRLGGQAVIMGQSISGGAATIAAATAPDLVSGAIELAPFTRKQPVDLGGLLRTKRFRAGYTQLGMTMSTGNMKAWKKYLDLAYPAKPADRDRELARIEAKLSEPGRMKALQAMCQANPGDAGAQMPNVACH